MGVGEVGRKDDRPPALKFCRGREVSADVRPGRNSWRPARLDTEGRTEAAQERLPACGRGGDGASRAGPDKAECEPRWLCLCHG